MVIAIRFGQNWLIFCDLKYLIGIYRLKGPCLLQGRWLICSVFEETRALFIENARIVHNHLKLSKLKIKDFGIDPNSREAITVVVSSFTGHSGNWAADHADNLFLA